MHGQGSAAERNSLVPQTVQLLELRANGFHQRPKQARRLPLLLRSCCPCRCWRMGCSAALLLLLLLPPQRAAGQRRQARQPAAATHAAALAAAVHYMPCKAQKARAGVVVSNSALSPLLPPLPLPAGTTPRGYRTLYACIYCIFYQGRDPAHLGYAGAVRRPHISRVAALSGSPPVCKDME